MKIDENIISYLSGKTFTSKLVVDISKRKYSPKTRESIILDITKEKSVIHIGCSDHLDIIDEKIKAGKWLHKLLTEQCKDCFGIDLNEESINYLKKDLGYKNVERGDILLDEFPPIKSKNWDYVLFGEIVEHLDNPVEFLSVFKSKYENYVGKFIITVPNIFTLARFRYMKNYKEVINSDHRFWFTPYTISKVISESGMKPENIYYGNLTGLSTKELVKRKIRKIFGLPIKYSFMHFSTLVVTGSIK